MQTGAEPSEGIVIWGWRVAICLVALTDLRWSQGVQIDDVHPDAPTAITRGSWDRQELCPA